MRNKRTYSLFVRENDAWVRITPLALHLEGARRLFQGALLSGTMRGKRMELRPAVDDMEKADEYKANRTRILGEGN